MFHIKMRTLIFLGGLSVLLLGKVVNSSIQGHLDLHLDGWDFLTVMEAFCDVGPSPQVSMRCSWQRSRLWLHLYSPTLSPGQKPYLLLSLKPFFISTPLPLKIKKKSYLFSDFHSPCRGFVFSNGFPHLLPSHKWLISSFSVYTFCQVTSKPCPLIKIHNSPSQILLDTHRKSVSDLSNQ